MVYVPSARQYGFDLRLNEDVMREALNSQAVRGLVAGQAAMAGAAVAAHVRAVASADDAENYVAAMRVEDGESDDYGFDFSGRYELGNRPASVVAIPAGRGPNPSAKPPLMVEAETHALTSVPGFTVGGQSEDIR